MKSNNVLILAVLFALLSIPLQAISQDNLLIIAADDFIDELQPLKRFKDCSGRPTILLSLNQVYWNFSGADEAEKVKKCIAHYENTNGIKHVILVGDIDKFPARWHWWGLPGQREWAVTDLYYADLYKNGTKNFDDWDDNNNGLYGEMEFDPRFINNDKIDFLPDVSVGRIPASKAIEVSNYVNKVIAYELKTSPFDTWFKKAALYTGSMGFESTKNKVATYLTNRGFKSTDIFLRYDHRNYSDPSGTFVSDLNGGVGFVNYLGHGYTVGWEWFNHKQIESLTNSDKLPIIFAGACNTGKFALQARREPYVDVNGQEHRGYELNENLDPGPYPHASLPRPATLQDDGNDGGVTYNGVFYPFDPPCIAEIFLFNYDNGSGGAIAYLGERTGGRIEWGSILDEFFFKAYDSGGFNILGDMWKYMLEEYYKYFDLKNSHKWKYPPSKWNEGHKFAEPQKFILFGDPSLIVGGAFSSILSGYVFNGLSGPLSSYSRYRVIGNVTVPSGQTLTANPAASILFEDGKKITANSTNSSNGFIVNGTSDKPVCFISLAADPQSEHVVQGMKIKGQLRLINGGEIKLY